MSSIVRMLARARTQGAKRPTPTQSTCLYYDHDNEASKCVSVDIVYYIVCDIVYIVYDIVYNIVYDIY
jgi:hypothetical protein